VIEMSDSEPETESRPVIVAALVAGMMLGGGVLGYFVHVLAWPLGGFAGAVAVGTIVEVLEIDY